MRYYLLSNANLITILIENSNKMVIFAPKYAMMRKEDFFDAPLSRRKTLKIGDKVRFLNSTGGGIVTSLRGKDQVLVEDENGFDIPVLISECVVIDKADRLPDNAGPESHTCPSGNEPDTKTPKPVEAPFMETAQGERLNLSLAFLPVDPKTFMQSPFEAYLINESNYYLYFNYMSCKNNSWTSRYHGLIEPDTKLFLEEFPKSDINGLEHLCVQLLAFKKRKLFSLKNTLSIELRLDTVKFYKLHCFTKNAFFDEDALIVPLVLHDVPEKQMLVSASDIQAALYDREKEDRRRSKQDGRIERDKDKSADNKIEVDLHINQLVETASGMTNADMLNCQLSKFHETIKANAGKKGQKIVFIHGKGEGVLRTALEKELKTTYKRQCRFQDASFREYGFGATLVIIF